MAKEASNKGTIRKYYKQCTINPNKSKDGKAIEESKVSLTKQVSLQDGITAEDFFNTRSGPELVPKFSNQEPFAKKKSIVKPGSCPRNKRKVRQDGKDAKQAQKQGVLNELGPGTTIIVIQKNEDGEGDYSTQSIENFPGLEEEILKITSRKGAPGGKQIYKSENRPRSKQMMNSQSFCSNQLVPKGKPPKFTSPNDVENISHIPRLGEKRGSCTQKSLAMTNRSLNTTSNIKSSRVNSID